jgi:hypothetical protein
MRKLNLICGMLVIGLTSLSIARGAVPGAGNSRVTDDTALYQNLSEIQAPRAARPNFDGDIERLSGMEAHYRENLPTPNLKDSRLTGPMKRIASQQYRYSGKTQSKSVRN